MGQGRESRHRDGGDLLRADPRPPGLTGGLAGRAARLLSHGPLPANDIAREVLALSGNPEAEARAVATLLGPDRRFERTASGRWGLAAEADSAARPLAELRYAVVDIETTGSLRWRGHGIVEIAIVDVRVGLIGDVYHTVVDPGRPLASLVTELTGITQGMVSGAPSFEHVADQVASRLEGRVFVAHNVGFDWPFVRSHLQRSTAGAPDVPRLCTVHLARRLLPRLRRRNLDALADHFGIEIRPRHRAYGDALATARVLLRLLDEARLQGLDDLESLLRFVETPGRRGKRGGREPRSAAEPLSRP